MAMNKKKAEEAVRTYLNYLQHPASVEGPDIEHINIQIEETADPITKLKLIAEREQMKDIGPKLEEDFKAGIKPYLDANEHIKPQYLIELGVPPKVLRDAGIKVSGGGGSKRSKPKAKRVKGEDIEQHILALRKGVPFTVAQISTDTGGSTATVSKVINQLAEQGKVADQGADPDHSGRGRAPNRYARA